MDTFFREFPLGVPFYNTREDFRLLQTALDLNDANGHVLWGVDQVFMAGSRFVFYHLASELAEMNGSHAVNFKITGIKGVAQGAMGPASAFDNSDNIHPLILQSLGNRSHDENWILLDMRPLRKLNTRVTMPIREIIHSYDFWILVPEANPVTMIYAN